MFKRILPVAASALLAGGLLLATVLPASAHERRDVGNAKYTMIVGFLVEPALQGYPNGVDMRVMTKADNKPVMGVEKTLKVELQNGADKKPMDLRTVFGKDGAYAADFVPTKPGTYRFVFSGKIEDTPINETFESGPGRFNDVDPLASAQFPAVSPSGNAADDSGNKVTAAQAQAQAALDQAKETEQKASTAMVIGAAGLLVGLIGIGVGAAAFAVRRR
jgi:hypothetical protein